MSDAVPAGTAPLTAHAGVAAARRPPPSGTPGPEHFAGHPTVGTFFFDSTPLGGKSTQPLHRHRRERPPQRNPTHTRKLTERFCLECVLILF